MGDLFERLAARLQGHEQGLIAPALRSRFEGPPELDEPHVVYDNEKNAINISIVGKVGPIVNVKVEAGKESFLAGLAEGVWNGYDALERAWGVDKRFDPRMSDETRAPERERWKRAVERSRNWEPG